MNVIDNMNIGERMFLKHFVAPIQCMARMNEEGVAVIILSCLLTWALIRLFAGSASQTETN